MTEERASGVVLRIHPYGDTSVILHWLTAEQGRLATLAKGARRPKSPLHGKLDLLSAGDFSYVPARRSSLHTLREFSPEQRYLGLRSDYGKLVQVAYAVALLERATESDTPLPEQYELFRSWLEHLERQPAQPRMVYAWEARLLESLGVDPSEAAASLRPEVSELLRDLLTREWEDLAGLTAAGPVVRQLSEFLRRSLVEAIGAVPKSRAEAISLRPEG